MLQLTDENFQKEVIDEKTLPVFVDFYAQWCGPCQMIGPIIDELSQEYSSKIKICKLNVDEASQTASKYGVMSIPTFLIFKNGKIVKQLMSALTKGELVKEIENILK